MTNNGRVFVVVGNDARAVANFDLMRGAKVTVARRACWRSITCNSCVGLVRCIALLRIFRVGDLAICHLRPSIENRSAFVSQ